MKVDLSIDFLGKKFENPFVLAAAPSTDNLDMVRRAFDMGWSGAVLKTTSVEGKRVEIAYPMLRAIQFKGKKFALGNIDLISVHHINEVEKRVKTLKREYPRKVVMASIMGSSKEEWQTLVKRLEDAGVDIIECSFSCPQGSMGEEPGKMLAQSSTATERVTGWVVEARDKVPILIKITPQVTDIVEIAKAVKRGGADGITASNTIPALMGINLETFVPYPEVNGKSIYSGLSGPAIKPITLRVIAEIKRNTGLPIAGTGGAWSWRDAVEFMLVGASIVQFTTAVMFEGFKIINHLREGLVSYLEGKGIPSVSQIIGKSLPHIVSDYGELPKRKVKSRIDLGKCIKCGACHTACRDGGNDAIIFGEERIPKVIEGKCTGCALCREVCPVEGCITMEIVG
jgi:dihydropyrimidine dehydrogenase (NAD+) subunit PreA